MKLKAVVAASLIIILSLASLMVLQKDRIKTGVKILSSQLRNTAWQYGEEYGYKYRLALPPGHATADSNRKYPLVVYLHGASERGSDNRIQIYDLWYLGAGGASSYEVFQARYPSVVYVPQCPADKTWNDGKALAGVAKTIEALISKYPIDAGRLYLIGYSMGGSGSYALAEYYFRETGRHFAAIIRLAGQSVFDQKSHEVVAKSSVWLHVGLRDFPIRLQAAETAYRKLAELHPGAVESSRDVAIPDHPGKVRTLTLSGVDVAKLSQYTNDGHAISEFPFYDPQLLNWLFSWKQH